MNWKYTLWKREYDNGKEVFVSTLSRNSPGAPNEGSLENLADYYHRNRPRDNSLTFDPRATITTIPALVRKKGQFIDIPATKEDILEFERVLDEKFNG